MASPKGIDPKKDQVFFVGIPDWAVDLDEEYKAAIFAFFMSEQIFGTDESETEEEIRENLSACFKGEDKSKRVEFLMKLFLEHGVIKPV